MANQKLVIGVAGHTGSGKTTVAQFLSTQYGFQYLRYSLVLAEWRGINPYSKPDLQELGWDVMSGSGQEQLNSLLIQRIDRKQDCAVDGLRHIADYQYLRREFASRFALVFLKASKRVRFSRLGARFMSYEDFIKADSHPVESNIDFLLGVADLVLDSDVSLPEVENNVTSFVSSFRKSSM